MGKSIDNTEYGNDSQREELRQAFFRVRDNAKYIWTKLGMIFHLLQFMIFRMLIVYGRWEVLLQVMTMTLIHWRGLF